MKDERKLAVPDRAADGQFSCDTGLSRPVPPARGGTGRGPSSARRWVLNAVRLISLDRPPPAGAARNGRALIMRAIKCLKGVRWMPWHAQAMKDVVRCEKPWGAANKL